MPLQGLEDKTKRDLLEKVVKRQLSLKEMREAADNIKQKRNLTKAFAKFTGEDSWETLQARFPKHATEEKIAQFKGVKVSRGKIAPVSLHLPFVAILSTSIINIS